ncbi:MAG: 23S rRNA (uracil(1939)-C(5))-methyltransferase RlmD [bacterium]|nr:23S rRNA (uracil(1939)-C(5))-methyltransferase RlmD [bacterium]
MKLFEQVEGSITDIDGKGHGILKKDGKEIRAFFGIPGDRVRLTLTKRKKGELRGKIDEIISPSSDRIHPPCPYVGKCGGCVWQMIDYPAQLLHKRNLVNRAFAEANLPFHIEAVEAAPELFYFRNRMDYVFGRDGELGLKEPERWWSVLNLDTCFLLSEPAVVVMQEIRAWAKRWKLEPWDGRRHAGFLRYVVIREGKNTKERMVTLVTGRGELSEDARHDLVNRLSPLTTTLYWGINPLITDLSISQELHLLSGNPYLTEMINGNTYRIHPNSFFQTNSSMAARLMDAVRDGLGSEPINRLLDLYCGLGFFAIGLADRAKEIIGVELDEPAIVLARENAALNDRKNITFHAGPTEKILSTLPQPDAVIVDPPRSGLHPKALETLLSLAPDRIVYVSCNYHSLIKELPKLLASYTITSLRALDLFPHTPHVEVVVVLERRT